jgi:Tfp pilus assembly protein PilF
LAAKRRTVESFSAVPILTPSAKISQRLFLLKNALCLRAIIQYKKRVSRPRFIALVLVLGTLAVYLPAAHHGFTLYDDNDYVTENPVVKNGLTWAGVKWAFAWHACNWHPLTWISHMADCQIFGSGPEAAGMHHSVNVLFHAANSILLLLLLLRWTNALWPSAFATALFAWHPLHVESVAWIAERKDVLSTFFALLTLLAYTRFVEESKVRPPSPDSGAMKSPTSKIFFAVALLMFALGLMAKPMLVTLPFVMLLLDYWPLRRVECSNAGQPATFNLQLVIEKWPFFALAAASSVVTFLAQHRGGAVASLENVPLHYRLENVPVAYAGYLLKMIWPAHLAVFYPLNSLSRLEVAAAVAALVATSWLVWRVRRPCPYWLVGWLWFLGTLVPVIGLVQVGGAAMADRYTYFPSIGIFLAAALGVRDGAEQFQVSKSIVGAVAGLVLAACLVFTHNQLNYWRDDIALFSRAIAVTKDNDKAHLNLGFALDKAGRKTGAMAEYRTVLKLEPDRVDAHNNLANLLDDTGHPDAAAAEYQEALRLNPKYVAAHNNYGTLLVELGRFDEAMKQYAAAARLDPADWHPPYLTGKALLKQGRDAEAISYFRQAIQLDPKNPQMLTYLAQVLASDENPQVRDGNHALAMAARANDLTAGVQPAMLDALAMAYAEIGQFTNAQQSAAYALKLATAYAMTNDVPLIEQRLQLYQNNQPFRQSFLFTNAPAKKME